MANFLQRLLFLVGMALAIGVAIWVSITLFAFLLVIGGVAVLYVAARRFLTEKGILNPTPGVPMDEAGPVDITIIDGEFEQIENPMVKQEPREPRD